MRQQNIAQHHDHGNQHRLTLCNILTALHGQPLFNCIVPCSAEEEKAAAEAEAAVAAREATPEVSEEGEIPVDAEEMEEISKAQQQAVSKQAHPSPVRRQGGDRGRDRDRTTGSDRDRGPPGRDRQVPSSCFGVCMDYSQFIDTVN